MCVREFVLIFERCGSSNDVGSDGDGGGDSPAYVHGEKL